MGFFTGTYEVKLEANQRLAIPAKLREQMPESQTPQVTLGDDCHTLWLYESAEQVQQRVNQLDGEIDKLNRRIDEREDQLRPAENLLQQLDALTGLKRLCLRWCFPAKIDSQGRIRIPEQLLNKAQMQDERQVVILGENDHLVIQGKAAWELADLEQTKLALAGRRRPV